MRAYTLLLLLMATMAVANPQISADLPGLDLSIGGDADVDADDAGDFEAAATGKSCTVATEAADCGTNKFGPKCVNVGGGSSPELKCRCTAGSQCASGVCKSEFGALGYGKCKRTCNGNGQCDQQAGETCISGECAQCSPTKPCTGVGQICVDGECITPECSAQVPCPSGETCTNGTCVPNPPTCTAQCTLPKICVNNMCKHVCTLTIPQPEKCPEGKKHCKNGECVECTDDTHCTGGKKCKNNKCESTLKPCSKYDHCPNGFYCKRQTSAPHKVCVEGCKTKGTPCKTKTGKSGLCDSSNKCTRGRGFACNPKKSGQCDTGFKCVKDSKHSYNGHCRKVSDVNGECNKGKFPNVCKTGLKCKDHKCVAQTLP